MLIFFLDAPRITIVSGNPLNVLENADAHLSCSVIASPPARSIRWVRNNHLLSTTPNHTIRAVTAEDSGNYTCVADNGVGEPSKAILELIVLCKYSVLCQLLDFFHFIVWKNEIQL